MAGRLEVVFQETPCGTCAATLDPHLLGQRPAGDMAVVEFWVCSWTIQHELQDPIPVHMCAPSFHCCGIIIPSQTTAGEVCEGHEACGLGCRIQLVIKALAGRDVDSRRPALSYWQLHRPP
jgi:hypothetical protein